MNKVMIALLLLMSSGVSADESIIDKWAKEYADQRFISEHTALLVLGEMSFEFMFKNLEFTPAQGHQKHTSYVKVMAVGPGGSHHSKLIQRPDICGTKVDSSF